jgi:DedD protein
MMTMADRNEARLDFNPKHRIAGAVILVALVVIFVPMLLNENEPPPELKGAREIPPRGNIETKVIVAPVAGEEAKPGQTPEAATKTETASVATDNAPKPETKTAPVEKSAKVPAVAEKITQGWVVQVGTFSSADNASHLRDKLKSHGHAVLTESVSLSGKKAQRLRVGPFRDKEQAVKAQAQIHKELHVQGVVQSYP